jgi:hypothetical protein
MFCNSRHSFGPQQLAWAPPSARRTSPATMAPTDSFTISPGTSPAAGTVAERLLRRTEAFSASRDLSAARLACARSSWKNPRAALKTSRTAMIAASTYSVSSTMGASSARGTGAERLGQRPSQRMRGRVGHGVGAELLSRRRASSLVRLLPGRPQKLPRLGVQIRPAAEPVRWSLRMQRLLRRARRVP